MFVIEENKQLSVNRYYSVSHNKKTSSTQDDVDDNKVKKETKTVRTGREHPVLRVSIDVFVFRKKYHNCE